MGFIAPPFELNRKLSSLKHPDALFFYTACPLIEKSTKLPVYVCIGLWRNLVFLQTIPTFTAIPRFSQ